MVVRVRARRRGTDHGHTHGHDHGLARHDDHVAHGDHPEVDPVSRKGLLALAVAGGILPSPTAFVVLTGAIYAHRVGYGLALILAFSVGLAAALMGVGMVALRARAIVSRRLGDGVSSLVSILSASLIVGFGMFFSARGLRAAFQPSVAVALALGVPVAALGVILARRRAPAPA